MDCQTRERREEIRRNTLCREFDSRYTIFSAVKATFSYCEYTIELTVYQISKIRGYQIWIRVSYKYFETLNVWLAQIIVAKFTKIKLFADQFRSPSCQASFVTHPTLILLRSSVSFGPLKFPFSFKVIIQFV